MFYYLGGDLKYYEDSIMCGNEYNFEMLQSNSFILLQQCQRNAQNNKKYKLILGNYNYFL